MPTTYLEDVVIIVPVLLQSHDIYYRCAHTLLNSLLHPVNPLPGMVPPFENFRDLLKRYRLLIVSKHYYSRQKFSVPRYNYINLTSYCILYVLVVTDIYRQICST